ncbi:MAG: PH domain-containing protein [Acidimicrobiales bacterium]
MSFPTKLLGPGEEIYLDSRPNWSYLFWPFIFTALVLAGCVVAVVLWTRAPSYLGLICLGVGLVVAAYLGARYLGWRTTTFVVTSQRIVYRTGVLRRTGREIPIGRVQDVTYHQTIVERIVRAGSLTVESAGRHGQDPFPDISKPDMVQSLINRVVTQSAGGFPLAPGVAMISPAGSGQAGPPLSERSAPPITDPTPIVPPQRADSTPRPVATPTVAQQLGELADLHRQGVVTDAEYEQKRRELLDRL